MKSKKGFGWGFVAWILLAMILLVISVLFYARYKEISQDKANKNICKSSVRTMDLASFKHIFLVSDIKCPMQEIEIKEKNSEAIKQELARLYYNVCDEFGQGTLNLFGKRETTFCVIRDKLTFSNKDIVVNDFGKYIGETYIPGKKLTYSEFCSGFTTERASKLFGENEIGQLPDVPIYTSKEYVIMFVYSKGEEEIREFTMAAFGTSTAHKIQYIGAALIVGGGYMIYTGKGAILGIPMLAAGNILAYGIGVTTAGGILNYFTNENLRMEWASFFLIREFDEEELKKLPCEYLPAEQG